MTHSDLYEFIPVCGKNSNIYIVLTQVFWSALSEKLTYGRLNGLSCFFLLK